MTSTGDGQDGKTVPGAGAGAASFAQCVVSCSAFDNPDCILLSDRPHRPGGGCLWLDEVIYAYLPCCPQPVGARTQLQLNFSVGMQRDNFPEETEKGYYGRLPWSSVYNRGTAGVGILRRGRVPTDFANPCPIPTSWSPGVKLLIDEGF